MKLHRRQIAFHVEIHRNRRDRPWLVMLHGFMGSGEGFRELINALGDHCNPVTVDLAGHGRSGGSDRSERYTADQQVADLVSILARLQLRPLILYGYSMGGRLALLTALHRPDLLDGLILESTTPGPADSQQRKERQRLDRERAQRIETDFATFLDEWERLPLFAPGRPGRGTGNGSGDSSPENEPDGAAARRRRLAELRSVMERQNPARLAASLRGFGTGVMPPVTQPPDGPLPPALLLAGETDTKFIDEQKRLKSLLPDAAAAVVPEAGHRIHLDRPQRLAETIEPFLKTYRL